MKRFVADVVGAFVEAWAELRVNKLRVLLSLVGVAVAVAALTGVVGLGSIAEQATRESSERASGRPATYFLSVYSTGAEQPDPAAVDAAFRDSVARYSISYAGGVTYTNRSVQFPGGTTDVGTQIVDVPYGEMHRVAMSEGSWFTDADAQRLAPALIVNEAFMALLGSPDLSSHPTVTLRGEQTVTAVVTGIVRTGDYDTYPSMYMLPNDWRLQSGLSGPGTDTPQYEMWLPTESGEEVSSKVQADMRASLGDGVQVDSNRQDYEAFGDSDPLGPIKLIIAGVGVLVLVLGGLGLVNIALVTVRQRIREIGVRRSFGATAPRVFFSVMLESVVGTVVAGAVGVMVAVFVVENPLVQDRIAAGGLADVPPFPVEAALLGLAAATVIGAIAGLLPALVAVRVKVIDAIRY
ncbi:ABC transporter permease [Frigoribacterium sp. 2-23]|uniref:ABC transporter permease n=1 Tax=Frigoribacterium sp. 2-23 TaxID=3415006 RepID=UPI003C6FEBCE